MSEDIIGLIIVLSWWFLYFINSFRIDKLMGRIEKLEKKSVPGKWEKILIQTKDPDISEEFTFYKCSICGERNRWKKEICPNCYSEMIVDEAKEVKQ